jgi:hypothetical protein
MSSLMAIISQPGAVADDARLMAAVLAKNFVGSSLRKTAGTREWDSVEEPEKAHVR